MLKINVNGEPRTFNDKVSVKELIDELLHSKKLLATSVAVAINQTIVPRSEWSSYLLADGDQVEFFSAVAGG